MSDTLEGLRQIWREYGLSKSEGSGWEVEENGDVKRFGGVVKKPSDFRYCFSDFVIGSKPDAGGGVAAKSSKRNRRTG